MIEDRGLKEIKKTLRKLTRRDFLLKASSIIAGTAVSSSLLFSSCREPGGGTVTPGEDVIYSSDTLRENRIPPGQHETRAWPVLQYDAIPNMDIQTWKFTVSGLVENPVTLDFFQFTDLPHVKVFSDIHCVTGWSLLGSIWEGISSGTISDLAKVKPEAKYVIVEAENGFFTANLTLADFLAKDVLFAIKRNDEQLEAEHGAPVRLVVPKLYFWKSAKWVTGLEFTAVDHPGFWESAGYNNHGDPWKEERY